jgi:hypothetical protein
MLNLRRAVHDGLGEDEGAYGSDIVNGAGDPNHDHPLDVDRVEQTVCAFGGQLRSHPRHDGNDITLAERP